MSMERREAVRSRLALIQQYRGHELLAHMIHLCDEIVRCYEQELLDVRPEELAKMQGAAKQLLLLREALLREGHDVPKL